MAGVRQSGPELPLQSRAVCSFWPGRSGSRGLDHDSMARRRYRRGRFSRRRCRPLRRIPSLRPPGENKSQVTAEECSESAEPDPAGVLAMRTKWILILTASAVAVASGVGIYFLNQPKEKRNAGSAQRDDSPPLQIAGAPET